MAFVGVEHRIVLSVHGCLKPLCLTFFCGNTNALVTWSSNCRGYTYYRYKYYDTDRHKEFVLALAITTVHFCRCSLPELRVPSSLPRSLILVNDIVRGLSIASHLVPLPPHDGLLKAWHVSSWFTCSPCRVFFVLQARLLHKRKRNFCLVVPQSTRTSRKSPNVPCERIARMACLRWTAIACIP